MGRSRTRVSVLPTWTRHVLYWLLALLLSVVVFVAVAHTDPPPLLRPLLEKASEKVGDMVSEATGAAGAGPVATDTGSATGSPQAPQETRGEAATTQRGSGPDWTDLVRGALVVFLFNLRPLALISLPFVGPAMYPVSLVLNAWLLRYIVSETPGAPPVTDVVLGLLAMPHAVPELAAYSIVFVESCIMTKGIWDRLWLRRPLGRLPLLYLLSLALSLLLLFTAALLETGLLLSRT